MTDGNDVRVRRLITVLGTHGLDDDWWGPDSGLVKAFESREIPMLSRADKFTWTGHLDGVDGSEDEWEQAGKALYWYGKYYGLHEVIRGRRPSLVVVAHSHGGQVAAFAAANGLRIDLLVTVATPVRRDMENVYSMASNQIGRWVHLYSDESDWWQWLGEMFDGRLGVVRKMPSADENIEVPGVGHSGLLRADVWDKHDIWSKTVSVPVQ